ncbi:mitogen-activated protein kinase kinase kinase 7-like [Haemaphysalis longicornis]
MDLYSGDSSDSFHSGSSLEWSGPFVEEIDHREIELFEVVGKGTFGLVRKGRWRGQDVAVKSIASDHEKRAFLVEVRQLSRVDHPNIVKLYGARVRPPVCLVMEYAEGGSLYNVLHTMKQVQYTLAHALSWVLQCARGVAYLHSMKPKALVHRDLKPPNLLLVNGGTVLKICDFGTACDVQTQMTNNKGSAAWMAPEVFESSTYTEKCDIFSWGIILWEVLTRRKPFEDCGPPAFCIMWAVHQGKRPPLIRGCPAVLEQLMVRCWSQNPEQRPPMAEVKELMEQLSALVPGADVPIAYPQPPREQADDPPTEDQWSEPGGAASDPSWGSQRQATSLVVQGTTTAAQAQDGKEQMSAPASLSCSSEDLQRISELSIHEAGDTRDAAAHVQPPVSAAGLPSREGAAWAPGHRRAGSAGSQYPVVVPGMVAPGGAGDYHHQAPPQFPKWTPGGMHSRPHPSFQAPLVQRPDPSRKVSWPSTPECPQEVDLGLNAHLLIEPALQPLGPVPSCQESVQVFEEHRSLAQWYFKLQSELCLLKQRSKELDKELQQPVLEPQRTFYDEMEQLDREREQIQLLRESLKSQLQLLKQQHQQPVHQQRGRSQSAAGGQPTTGNEDWVMVSLPR